MSIDKNFIAENWKSSFAYQKVNAVGVTKSLIEGIETAEDLIAYQARVSNPTNQMNTQTAGKLLKYCFNNAHFSVFETVNIQFEIITTRDIARQILRHRSAAFQEFSNRYADPTEDLGFVTREARLQDTKNRQNSIETSDYQFMAFWEQYQKKVQDTAIEAYRWGIEHGIAKEQARAVLPEGMILSRMYMNCTLRTVIHYCDVRMHESTQKEHRDVAVKMWRETVKHFPFLKEM